MSAPVQGGPGGRGGFVARAAAAGCLALIVWMGLGWDALRSRASYTGRKTDYYSLQVHGFLSGHLSMESGADPGRAASPGLDASYYNGRYYLYFGAAPAALLLLPYAWLTGGDLEPRFVVVLCAALGFVLSLAILRMAARDFLLRPGAWFGAAAALVLGLSSAVAFLLARAMFYEVPIAAGYACTMAGVFFLYRALFGRGSAPRQLALASLCLGLSVGCRPDLVLDVPVLAAAAFLVAWRARAATPWKRALARMGAAALGPAAAVGACLALYNYRRFGNPLEFGISYSLNTFTIHHNRLASAAYLWPNIRWYYLTLPALSPFFPYVFPQEAYFGPPGYAGGEAMHGQFPVFVLAAFVAVSAIMVGRRLGLGRLRPFLGLVAWMFLSVFLAMSALGVRADRYMVDFQPALVLLVVLLAVAVASALGRGIGPGIWRLSFAVLAAFACAFNFFGGLQEFDAFKNIRTGAYKAMESLGNYPSYWLAEAGLLKAGPLELSVIFPTELATSSIEPLLTAGTPDCTDSLYAIEWAGGRQFELMGEHHGYGGPSSDVIAITPGKAYTLRIDMGALYPPLRHPFFGPYKAMQARLMKTTIHVEMDGRTVLDRKMNSYDAPPWTLEPGRNDVSLTPFKTGFSGRILSIKRLAPPAPLPVESNSGLWRIRCVFPLQYPGGSFPLLSAGAEGSATLVYLSALPGNRVRFGLDEWGAGGASSDAFKAEPKAEHVVELCIGPLARRTNWPGQWAIPPDKLGLLGNDLRVWLDGRLAWTTRLHLQIEPLDSQIEVGANPRGLSTALADYPGPIRSAPYSAAEAREFLDRNIGEKPQG